MYLNYSEGTESDILKEYGRTQLIGMVKRYEIDPFFRINATITISNLGDDSALDYLVIASVLSNEWSRDNNSIVIQSTGSIVAFYKVWKSCYERGLNVIGLNIDSIMSNNFPIIWNILKTS